MITAVDTNVLIDVFHDDQEHRDRSLDLIRNAYDVGAIVVSSIVYAELAAAFLNQSQLDKALSSSNFTVSHIDSDIAFEAGRRWRQYLSRGGPRSRIITDFLIGAHALIVADQFLTRDRGFFSTYFPELTTN